MTSYEFVTIWKIEAHQNKSGMKSIIQNAGPSGGKGSKKSKRLNKETI